MSTAPKPFAFVLMPFSPQFDDAYELAIKPACDVAGAYGERVDKQIFTGSILDRIFNQISKADLIIADMSERNPNVFYEVGYAHALGKQTILLTRAAGDIPFDLNHYPHIIYGDSLSELKTQLERRIKWHIEHPSKPTQNQQNLLIRVNGVEINTQPEVTAQANNNNVTFQLRIEIQNRIIHSINNASFQVGLFTSGEFVQIISEPEEYKAIRIDENKNLFLVSKFFVLLPEVWDSISIWPATDNRYIDKNECYEFILRIYRESGYIDFPFVVKTVSTNVS